MTFLFSTQNDLVHIEKQEKINNDFVFFCLCIFKNQTVAVESTSYYSNRIERKIFKIFSPQRL